MLRVFLLANFKSAETPMRVVRLIRKVDLYFRAIKISFQNLKEINMKPNVIYE